MTNEKLLKLGRSIQISDKDEWLVKDRILFMYRPAAEHPNEPDKFALLFNDGERVASFTSWVAMIFTGSYFRNIAKRDT
jgi:hypothetical protein